MKEEKITWPKGLKKTKAREQVLALLEKEKRPVSALEISAKLEGGENPVWLSTVYRVLEQFVKSGVITKLSVMNSDTAVYELNRFHHKHYAVCMSCRKITPMENCPMEAFIPRVKDDGFQVVGHNVEVYGYCKDCACEKKTEE
ncbi:MAG TPA: Fur family transcriptional regulator [Clostridia bacterium]|nr:Fur family transcriptional regulator [Clostridia bacterium]